MLIQRALILAACLLLAAAARAQDVPEPQPAVSDVVYKGVFGKVLDAVPMDPDERVTLQKTGAVVSGATTGRSLALWAGLTHPVFLIAGAVWGLFSASNIKTADARSKPAASRVALSDSVETAPPARDQVALLAVPPEDAKGE